MAVRTIQRSAVAAAVDRVLRDIGALRRPALFLSMLQMLLNAVPGAALLFYLQFLDPGVKGVPHPARAGAIVLRVFIGLLVVGIPLGVLNTGRGLRPVTGWLGAGRPATPREQRAVLAEPFRSALQSLATWVFAAAAFGSLEAALGYPSRRVALIVSS